MGPPHRLDSALRQRLAGHLAAFAREPAEAHGLVGAAVALAIVPGVGEEAALLLTRRTASLSKHGGQFALPGGRTDAGEDSTEAARRELDEELGVRLGPDSVLGLLDDYPTRSGYLITPVVLWAASIGELRPNIAEVAAAYRVPLHELERPDSPLLVSAASGEPPVLALPLLGTHIYSPTAAMLLQFREVALHGRTLRVRSFGEPRFAWK